MSKKQFVYEDTDTEVGGGATGKQHSAAPVAKGAAGLPNSKMKGENTPVHTAPIVKSGLEPEETDHENNTKPEGNGAANMGTLKPTGGKRDEPHLSNNGRGISPSNVQGLDHKGMKEDINALFGGSDLSEEFRNKALVVFEAAVNAQIEQVTESLEEQYAEKLSEAVDAVVDELAEKVDDYLNYVADEWMKENRVAVESGIRSEMVNSFLTGLKGLFQEHYVDIPEDDEEIVESLLVRVNDLEDQINEHVSNNIAIERELAEALSEKVLIQSTENLTESQRDKLLSLSKGIQYDTIEEFVEKVETLKETYFPSVRTGSVEYLINDSIEPAPKNSMAGINPDMAHYVNAISKTLKK